MNEEIRFEVVPEADVMPALDKANALVHNPFAWGDETEETEQS
jgi:hypothetical protein